MKASSRARVPTAGRSAGTSASASSPATLPPSCAPSKVGGGDTNHGSLDYRICCTQLIGWKAQVATDFVCAVAAD